MQPGIIVTLVGYGGVRRLALVAIGPGLAPTWSNQEAVVNFGGSYNLTTHRRNCLIGNLCKPLLRRSIDSSMQLVDLATSPTSPTVLPYCHIAA